METHKKIALLIFKYLQNTLHDQERDELQKWLDQSAGNQKLFNRLTHREYFNNVGKINKKAAWQKIISPSHPKSGRVFKMPWKDLVAAVIFLFIFGIGFYPGKDQSHFNNISKTGIPHDTLKLIKNNTFASPILLTANGFIIDLNDLLNTPPLRIGCSQITYKNRQIKVDTIPGYSTGMAGNFDAFTFPFSGQNTIFCPPDLKLAVTLIDGSQVTLNEKSTLSFPSSFAPGIRDIELTGEGYFKVMPQYSGAGTKIPFFVKAHTMKIKVLGTEFNVAVNNNDGTVKTTLLEGSVEVIKDTVIRTLVPGQEIILTHQGELTDPRQVNVEKAVAWKRSITYTNASLYEVLDEIGRIYNVTIMYTAKFDNRLTIHIPPKRNVSEALAYVKKIGIASFRINGKKVIVTK